jgi:hypothetical protein
MLQSYQVIYPTWRGVSTLAFLHLGILAQCGRAFR